MLSLQASINFFIVVILICAFFTLGRWTGWQEKRNKLGFKRVKPIVEKIPPKKQETAKRAKFDFEEDFSDSVIIDAEYEDVVDLQKYIRRRDRKKEKSVDETSEFTFIYSKRDGKLLRVPKEISDLLEEIRKVSSDIDRDGTH